MGIGDGQPRLSTNQKCKDENHMWDGGGVRYLSEESRWLGTEGKEKGITLIRGTKRGSKTGTISPTVQNAAFKVRSKGWGGGCVQGIR